MDARWFCAALFVGPSSFVFFAHFISATVTVAMTSTLFFGGARIEIAIDVGGRCFPGKMLRSGQSARGVLNAAPLGAAEARRTDRSRSQHDVVPVRFHSARGLRLGGFVI